MFDVFYIGPKPDLFAHEQQVENIEQAQKQSRTRFFWMVSYLVDYTGFDFLYEPVPWQSEYTHTWPNQHHEYSGTYLVPTVGEIKYYFHSRIVPNKCHPDSFDLLTDAEFDFTWAPHPHDPPYIYMFGNQWYPANIMPTVEYRVLGATERKYMDLPCAKLPAKHIQHWHTLVDCEWDYSWVPDPGDPPYIYVFGNQWWTAEKMPTMEYHVSGATDRKYMYWPRAKLLSDSTHWTVPDTIDPDTVDYSWVPDPGEPPYIYQFGTQHQRTGGPVYSVPSATEVKYVLSPRSTKITTDSCWTMPENINAESFDWTWHPDATEPPYIYQFGTQWQRTGGPVYTVPGATEVKYVLLPRSTKITTDSYWTVPEGADTDSFDWTWHPDTTESAYIYQFGTQHQRTGGPMYKVPGATEVKYVEQIKIKVDSKSAVIVEIDHLDGNTKQIPNAVKTVRYFDNYRDTLIRIAKSLVGQYEFVWICSSICNYEDFDFSWHPEQWQATMLHVFASDEQKFGDTFYMHVPSFAEYAERRELLEWYDCNFIGTSVPRRPMPVIHHNFDSHVDAVLARDFAGPLAIFSTGHSSSQGLRPPAVPLWRDKTKTIIPLSKSASRVIVPKVAIPYIRTQLYDYPHVDKTHCTNQIDSLMDVVFISYDEPDADHNWNILAQQCPRARRVHGVAGMETALEAAADLSSTPWYYAVFAKTRLHEQFDFSYVPDFMQQSKHYIFDCINTVNGLQYGHMGVVMYNCEGIRELNQAKNFGLDYTLSFAHESVPMVSCYGNFDQTPYHTWRTAFRECAKLAYFESQSPTVDGEYRLNTWLSRAQGNHADWCLKGAHDGVEFFNTSDQALATLKQSFRWEWLREYFISRYGDLQ
jgi:hypothetical protein